MFGSLLAKLGRGETLSPEEISQLERLGNSQLNNSYNESELNVFNLQATHGRIEFPVVNYFRLSLSGSSQTIPNNTITPIEWNKKDISPSGAVVYSTATNPERIAFRSSPAGHHILFMGHVVWDTNNIGHRTITVSDRDSSGGLLGGQTCSQVPAMTGIETVHNYFLVFNVLAVADHVTIDVVQASGGNLGLQYARLQSWWID